MDRRETSLIHNVTDWWWTNSPVCVCVWDYWRDDGQDAERVQGWIVVVALIPAAADLGRPPRTYAQPMSDVILLHWPINSLLNKVNSIS